MSSLTLTVEQAAEALQIGRSAAYEAVRRGDIPSVKIGRSLRVPRSRLEAMLEGTNANGSAANGAAAETGESAPDEQPV